MAPLAAKPDEGWRIRISSCFEWFALILATVTVCILPWILGSVIPLARLVLLVGSSAAMVCCMAGMLITPRKITRLPVAAILIVGLATVGIVQLLPIFSPPTSQMRHAVFPELRHTALELSGQSVIDETFAADNAESRAAEDSSAADEPVSASPVRVPRTVSSSDTRLAVVQWLCVAMLMLIAFETIRSPVRLTACLSIVCLNAATLTIVGLLQIFSDGKMMIGRHWMLSQTTPFGPFVNPNNAAGWLCVHLAAAVGLMVLAWGKTTASEYSRSFDSPSLRDHLRDILPTVQERLATLNNRQILVLAFVILLITGIAATLSRAGIIAALFALIACTISRLQWRQALVLLLPLMLLTGTAMAFLSALELDTLVLSELITLRDPVSETTGRMLHWTDSLQSVRDFPLLGSGMHAYEFSTLPYQAHSFEKWFRNADNHFVEMLVEGGLLGLLLFVLPGVIGLVAGLRLNSAANTQKKSERPRLLALALIAVALVASQSVAALFDFGIGLPANSAALALLLGAVFAPFADTESERSSLRSLRDIRTVVSPTHRLISIGIFAALLASAVSYISDLRAAHEIYDLVIESERLLKRPVSRLNLLGQPRHPDEPAPASLETLDQRLTDAMAKRPDDADGLQTAYRLREARFRFLLIDTIYQTPPLNEAQFENTWETLTPPGLASQLLQLRQQPDPTSADAVQSVVDTVYARIPWGDAATTAVRKVSVLPSVAPAIAACDLIRSARPASTTNALRVQFMEPADPRRLFQAGHGCLLQGKPELAEQLWKQALHVSETYRNAILLDALNHWSPADVIRLFAPLQYEHTVAAALSVGEKQLRELLWNEADRQWNEISGSPVSAQQVRRAHQLQHQVGDHKAVEWLTKCLRDKPDDLSLSVLHATLLEKVGRKRDALTEWSRIQYFHPDHQAADAAITRISDSL